MKKYFEKYEKKQAEKDVAIGEISKELQDVSAELEKENRKAINAVNAGNRDAYTVATSYISYLKQRQAALIRQRDEKAAEPVCSKNEFQAAQSEMLQETDPIRREMLTQFFKDWYELIGHFNESKATLERYNIECRKMAKLAGDESITDMTGRSREIEDWISSVERSPRFAQLKLIADQSAK